MYGRIGAYYCQDTNILGIDLRWKTKTVIIVGGGLAGGLTATSLQEQCKVTLFTKKN